MKAKMLLSLFIFLINWTLSGCKESAVEPQPEPDHYKGKIAFESYRNGWSR